LGLPASKTSTSAGIFLRARCRDPCCRHHAVLPQTSPPTHYTAQSLTLWHCRFLSSWRHRQLLCRRAPKSSPSPPAPPHSGCAHALPDSSTDAAIVARTGGVTGGAMAWQSTGLPHNCCHFMRMAPDYFSRCLFPPNMAVRSTRPANYKVVRKGMETSTFDPSRCFSYGCIRCFNCLRACLVPLAALLNFSQLKLFWLLLGD
jgi:hypothetical protein